MQTARTSRLARARRGGPALAFVLLSLLAGCGGGTRTVTISGLPKAAAASTTSTSSAASGARKAAAAKVPTPKAIVHLSAFQTPSGNIGCMILDGVARCDIVKRSWSPPSRPASCPNVVDYGQGLEIGSSGGAQLVCAGDTVREPKASKLAYGDATRVGSFQCVSEEDGLTCTRGHGHGFFISIQAYRTF